MVGIGGGTGRWAVPGILLVGVVALAGVALWPSPGSPEPAGTVTVPARTGRGTASDTASVPVPVPVLPEAAKAHDAAGAQAFVRYWFDVVNYTFASRDTALFRSLALPECGFCTNLAGKIDGRRSRGEYYLGGRFSVTAVASSGRDGTGSAAVDAVVSVEASQVLGAGGELVETDAGTRSMPVSLALRGSNGGWEVQNVHAGP